MRERLRIQRGSRVHLGRWQEGLRPRLCAGALALGYAGRCMGCGVFVGPQGGRVSEAWGTGRVGSVGSERAVAVALTVSVLCSLLGPPQCVPLSHLPKDIQPTARRRCAKTRGHPLPPPGAHQRQGWGNLYIKLDLAALNWAGLSITVNVSKVRNRLTGTHFKTAEKNRFLVTSY